MSRFKTGGCWYLRQRTQALVPGRVDLEQRQLLSLRVRFLLRRLGFYPFQRICRPAGALVHGDSSGLVFACKLVVGFFFRRPVFLSILFQRLRQSFKIFFSGKNSYIS